MACRRGGDDADAHAQEPRRQQVQFGKPAADALGHFKRPGRIAVGQQAGNSFTPIRANTSPLRSMARVIWLKAISAWSPMGWPKLSFRRLKWSRSHSSRAALRWRRLQSASSFFAPEHKGAAVAGAGQRIAEGGGLEAQLGTLLDHRQRDVGNADGIQHRFKQHEREKRHAFTPEAWAFFSGRPASVIARMP